ncbi:unnamed protein product [Heterobilharzia americana]|nr:unnamed protein product [Heterobilharzia americana]
MEWPIITEADLALFKYASDTDGISRAQMISDIRNRSVHWAPTYRRVHQQFPREKPILSPRQQQQQQQQRFRSLYTRSFTLGDSNEHIDVDLMQTKPETHLTTQILYTTPPPTNEREAYYNGLLMQEKLKEFHMVKKPPFKSTQINRFSRKHHHIEPDTIVDTELQGLLQKPYDFHQYKPTHSSTRRRWTSSEIPEVKITPVLVDLPGIQYDEQEKNEYREDENLGYVYPSDVHNYRQYSVGKKRPHEEQFPLHSYHQIPYEDQATEPQWRQTYKADITSDKYLIPHRGDSFRRAVSLDKSSFTPSSLYRQHCQQYHHQQHRQQQYPEESLESKFTRQCQFKYRLPYYSSSLDYPSSSSSKARPLLHPGYVQTYNFFTPIEEKGDYESEIKRHPLESKVYEGTKDILDQNEKIIPVQKKAEHELLTDKEKSSFHLITDDGNRSGGSNSNSSSISSRKKFPQPVLKQSVSMSGSTDEIVPNEKDTSISHKEVRISELQPTVSMSKKSVTLSSDINIQSKIVSGSSITPSSGVLKVSVHLGESGIQEFAEYWDHSIFSGARVTAVCLAGAASVCLVCTVCASTWLYQGYANNITYSGFWKRCNYINQTCEIMLPFLTKHDGWQDGAFFILILAILLSFLGLSLSVAGHLVYALPKRLYYFHSAGEAHVVAAFVTALSMLIYHITIRLHLRTDGPVNFGEAYGISWFACFLHLLAAILLLLDEIINELVNLATRVHCVRTCLKCIIHTYSRTVQKRRQLLAYYNSKFSSSK